MHPPEAPTHGFERRESFVSQPRLISPADLRSSPLEAGEPVASDWETVALTLGMAAEICPRDGRAGNGSCLVEMHWWDQVRVGDSLRVHARPLDPSALPSDPPPRGAMLLWTVNQSGRCVFSCLALFGPA